MCFAQRHSQKPPRIPWGFLRVQSANLHVRLPRPTRFLEPFLSRNPPGRSGESERPSKTSGSRRMDPTTHVQQQLMSKLGSKRFRRRTCLASLASLYNLKLSLCPPPRLITSCRRWAWERNELATSRPWLRPSNRLISAKNPLRPQRIDQASRDQRLHGL